jgi:hypothetical protein
MGRPQSIKKGQWQAKQEKLQEEAAADLAGAQAKLRQHREKTLLGMINDISLASFFEGKEELLHNLYLQVGGGILAILRTWTS